MKSIAVNNRGYNIRKNNQSDFGEYVSSIHLLFKSK